MLSRNRKAVRDAVSDATVLPLAVIKDGLEQLMAGFRAQASVMVSLAERVSAIEPAQVDLTQEMADDIVRKIHGPLTIPQGFSDWIKEQARYRDIVRIEPLGHGPHASTSTCVLKADGTMFWQFRDMNGAPLWERTFVPPGYGG
jgi:hypothetical protein